MSKKGATQSGSTAGRKKAKDAAMVSMMPSAPKTWNSRPQDWPYHSSKGISHRKPGGVKK